MFPIDFQVMIPYYICVNSNLNLSLNLHLYLFKGTYFRAILNITVIGYMIVFVISNSCVHGFEDEDMAIP